MNDHEEKELPEQTDAGMPADAPSAGPGAEAPEDDGLLDHTYLRLNILDEGISFILRDMVQTYRASAATLIQQISTAADAGDLKVVEFVAHRLKGASGAVGGAKMTSVTAAIEEAAAGGNREEASRLARSLGKTLEATVEALMRLV